VGFFPDKKLGFIAFVEKNRSLNSLKNLSTHFFSEGVSGVIDISFDENGGSIYKEVGPMEKIYAPPP